MLCSWGLLLALILLLFAGCISTSVGDVRYEGTTLLVPVTYSGVPSQGFLQVTVYGIRGLSQNEVGRVVVPVFLSPGPTELRVPLNLTSGSYKMYVYVSGDDERMAGVIRDLVIP
jgi:hypothetical protein